MPIAGNNVEVLPVNLRTVACCGTCQHHGGWLDNMSCLLYDIEVEAYNLCDFYKSDRSAIGANTMTEPVIWQGEQLPSLLTGHVWGMRIYPGGRRIVQPCDPDALMTPDSAVKRLRAGHMVEVRLDDAVMTLTLWQQEPT